MKTVEGTHPLVVRYRDGNTSRLTASVAVDEERQSVIFTSPDAAPEEVGFGDIKAVFFLNDPEINFAALEIPDKAPIVAVEFSDGEIIRGHAPGYSPAAAVFLLIPLERSRNAQIFVVSAAVSAIEVERL